MLTIEGLTRPGFGPFALSLANGTCCGIAGPSGAGKSVLLRMVADLDPHRGRVTLDGEDRSAMPGPAWRRKVVYLAAESGWWADRVGAHFPTAGAPFARDRERLRLAPGILDWPVARLSSGERQRLAFLRGLMLDPRVLLLDEPTAALDPLATATFEDMLGERLSAGTSALFVSHDEAQMTRVADRVYRIAEGRPAMAGATG